MATTAIAASMKLVIDRKAQRVLYAEASKEVVDFLFSLLALPLATVVKLVGKEAMVGSFGNLYASVDKLDSTYLQTGAAKDAFLCPTVMWPAGNSNSSRLPMPVAPALQGVVTYMVLDDLTVTPMSAISSITLLNTFAGRDIGDLHEMTVQLGYNEGLAVLKASLQSKSVLTDVFIHGDNKNKASGAGGRASN